MRAYERLLKYAKVYTTSDPESGTHPSAAREFDLAHLLVEEMKSIGIEDAFVDEHCYVYGSIPATKGCEKKPALGLIAHMDTAPRVPGGPMKARVVSYEGGVLVLNEEKGIALSPAAFPDLLEQVGKQLVVTDGTTLLGADDKAGVAEIFAAVERLVRDPRLAHGRVAVCITPDEEVGRGADYVDLARLGAAFAYTVDGGPLGTLEYENFNAAAAVVTVHGFSVHPGSAKNAMINAQNVAMEFHAALPAFSRPEHTEGREGFFHLTSMQGDVTTAHLGYIVRDYDAAKFAARKAQMQHIADCLNERYGAGTVELDIKDSYYNMLEKIQPHFHLVENARKAICAAGLAPIESPVRGGTDGATLSYMGLPCPNLGTGGFNFHGPCECITAEKMDQGVEILLNLVELYK
mgnify:CR=1 FL=1